MSSETLKETVQFYDKFLENNLLHPQDTLVFQPSVIPNDQYVQHRHTRLPPFREIWRDREMMLAFRKFLQISQSNENLSFFLRIALFEHVPEDQVETVAKEIFDIYFSPNAPYLLNIEYYEKEKIIDEINNPHIKMFNNVRDKILKVLELEWYPLFVVSDLYKSLNNESLDIDTRERSTTMDNYDLYVQYLSESKQLKEKEKK